jgi:hypothetical protein
VALECVFERFKCIRLLMGMVLIFVRGRIKSRKKESVSD